MNNKLGPSDGDLVVLSRRVYQHHTIARHGVEALIQRLDGHQVIAIRGTEDIRTKGGWVDLFRDVFLGTWFCRGLIGHAGFLLGAKSILHEIVEELDKDVPICLTGHSLGGGIAIPLAKYLKDYGYDVRMLVTFGCPRVLTWGHHYYKDMYVRQYEFEDDAIPTMQFWLPRKHITRVGLGEKRSKKWFRKRNLEDHAIDNYVEALSG